MKRLLLIMLSFGLILAGCKDVDETSTSPSKTTLTPELVSLSGDEQVSAVENSFTVECLKNSGNPDFSTEWTLTSGESWLKLSFNADGSDASASVTSTATRKLYLVVDENTSLDSRSAEIRLGNQTTAVATVTQRGFIPGTIVVTPQTIPAIDGDAHTPAAQSLTVTCSRHDGNPDPEAAWTLASSQTWLKLTLQSDGTQAAGSVNGIGTQTVYMVLEENKSGAVRTTDISLNGGTTPALSVTQEKMIILPPLPVPDPNALNGIVGGGELPDATMTYLGAFWRAGQIGERVIRTYAGGNAGEWSATVAWYDANWNPAAGDGVVLAAGDSADPNIRHAASEPGDAESYKVTGTLASISGTVQANDYITFRVGLTKAFSTYNVNTKPARYAVVLLTYGGGRKQKLFLRQGEGADYLMRPGDKDGNGASVGGADDRSFACKVTLFNLTASETQWAAKPGGTAAADFPQLGVNGGTFVNYPTQGGAIFHAQATDATLLRRAFSNTYSAAPTDWPKTYAGPGYWTPATDETCPAGYRRMQDGDPVGQHNSVGPVQGSEMRQSLRLTPIEGFGSSTLVENSVYGYYADGYFDRRAIVDGTSDSPGINGAVAVTTNEAAFRGRLFFNPFSNASLFFPAPGYRTSGNMQYIGDRGYYWMSSTSGKGKTACMYVTSGQGSAYSQSRLYGWSIRCVREQ